MHVFVLVFAWLVRTGIMLAPIFSLGHIILLLLLAYSHSYFNSYFIHAPLNIIIIVGVQ